MGTDARPNWSRSWVYLAALTTVVATATACRTWSNAPSTSETSKAPNSAPNGRPKFSDAQLDNDLTAYAEQCKTELGINWPLPDLNCLRGVEVPITVNGAKVDARLFEELKSHRQGCDRAQWLSGECFTYDLIQRVEIPGNKDIEGVLNCRQKTFTNHLSPKERIAAYDMAVKQQASEQELQRLYRLIFEFDDLGLIFRNKKSGKSCFFTFYGSFEKGNTFYGGWIPAPDRKEIPPKNEIFANLLPHPKPPKIYSETMWNRGPKGYSDSTRHVLNMFFSPAQTAAGDCVGCHNQGTFKHSPFIMQAQDAKGLIVPANSSIIPYLLVGPAFQESFRRAQHVEVTTEDIDGETQVCTSCHRMATGSEKRFEWSVGNGVPNPSKKTAAFPDRAWMPEDHGESTQKGYAENYKKHIDALRCCMKNPKAKGCLRRTFGPTLADTESMLNVPLNDEWIEGKEVLPTKCVN